MSHGDLQAAQTAALRLGSLAGCLCQLIPQARRDKAAKKLADRLIAELNRAVLTGAATIHAVAQELRATRANQPARFGDIVAASAHEVVIDWAYTLNRVLWSESPPSEDLAINLSLTPDLACARVQKHFALVNWPKVDELKAAVLIEAAAAAGRERAPQGKVPVEAVPLPWEGNEWDDLAPQIRLILRHMHGREQDDTDDFREAIWGSNAVSDGAVLTALARTNEFLGRVGYNRTLEKVRREALIRWK